MMQPTIKTLFARHSQRKLDSTAEPARACSESARSGSPSAFTAAAERTEPAAAAELAEAEVARPPGACPRRVEEPGAEPSADLSSSGELRPKKRGRAFDYFLVRLPAQFASRLFSSRGCADVPQAASSPDTVQVLDCEATCNQTKDLVRPAGHPWTLQGKKCCLLSLCLSLPFKHAGTSGAHRDQLLRAQRTHEASGGGVPGLCAADGAPHAHHLLHRAHGHLTAAVRAWRMSSTCASLIKCSKKKMH